MEKMRDHFRMVGALIAIALILTAMVIFIHQGQKLDTMSTLGFGVVLGNLTGAFSPSYQPNRLEAPLASGGHREMSTTTVTAESGSSPAV